MYNRLTQNFSKRTQLVAVPLFHLLLVFLLNDASFLTHMMYRDSRFCKMCKLADVVLENCKDWIFSKCSDLIYSKISEPRFWSNHFKTEASRLNDQHTFLLAHICISKLHTFDAFVFSAKIAYGIAKLNFINVSSFCIRQGLSKDFLTPLQFCQSKTSNFTPDVCRVAPSFEEYVPRLASFRSIFLAPGLASISYIRLAQSGFKYEDKPPYVRCVECGRESSIFSFVRDENCMLEPGTAEFHANGCSFISAGLESSVSGGVGEIASDENSSLTTASITGSRVSLIESQIQQGITVSKDDPTSHLDKHIGSRSEYAIPAQVSFPGECNKELTVATDLHNGSYEISGLKETIPHKEHISQNRKPEKINLLQKENRKLTEQLVCKVCNTGQVRELFMPCGELLACHECSKQLTHCPSCNVKIQATATVYFS